MMPETNPVRVVTQNKKKTKIIFLHLDKTSSVKRTCVFSLSYKKRAMHNKNPDLKKNSENKSRRHANCTTQLIRREKKKDKRN